MNILLKVCEHLTEVLLIPCIIHNNIKTLTLTLFLFFILRLIKISSYLLLTLYIKKNHENVYIVFLLLENFSKLKKQIVVDAQQLMIKT